MSINKWAVGGIAAVMLACLFLGPSAYAGNKKLMSIKAAEADAQRGIVECIVGLKIRGATKVIDMVADSDKIESKTAAEVKDIEITETIYDPEKDIAKVTARINVGRVRNVIGKNIDYGNISIERVGFGTSTESAAGPLKALRAAQLDAYRQMAQKIVGLQLESQTTVENFVMTSDDLKTKVLAAIYGAKLVSFNWDDEGDCFVKMSLKPNYVQDILGQKLRGEQAEIVVEGRASQKDDFAGEKGSGGGGSREIKEQSLGIPAPPGDAKAQGSSTTQEPAGASSEKR